jgi:4a-hydroxytetrahydrobiopterin dehydratase
MDLAQSHCQPCRGDTPPLDDQQIQKWLPQIPQWQLQDGKLARHCRFKHFKAAMNFLNRLAELAEAEGHHPDFCVHYNKVDLVLFTHAISALSQNDFILAAKIDTLLD